MAKTSSGGQARPATALGKAISRLLDHYGPTSSLTPAEPFELLLWEYVAYLTDDADRAAAFAALKKRVGVKPIEIASASASLLQSACRAGGAIAFKLRADRMHDVAIRVQNLFDGSLRAVLSLPYLEARRVLKTFPAIGPPGADKILLLTGAHAVLALDSNALRVLLRLGYGEEHKSYGASYASAQKAATTELPKTIAGLQQASFILRLHGQELCRRAEPRCAICPLEGVCAFASKRS